ncbi:MAG: hypothetical protein J3K34DRAFT_40086 [Monoraphidium minutum]|nr:MAG: hypothetical protein J3K34DRAFT_40086 [Monoraphidium minutum]
MERPRRGARAFAPGAPRHLPAASALFAALLLACAAAPAAAQCAAGDNPCWCRSAGGWWETPPAPLMQTCKMKFQHQGMQRTANVYLPPGFKPSNRPPMWIHLHGVFWRAMGDIGKQVGGWPVQAADATALWDKLAGGKANREGAVVVYPQSLGDPDKRQFFNNGFWLCSVGECIDKNIDDIGFIEQVVSQLPGKFGADSNRVFLSGKSAGGILVHAALCKSSIITSKVKAAVDILGGLPEPMAGACVPRAKTNVLLIHGVKDEHLPWSERVILDYVPFMSKTGAAAFWRGKYGLRDETTREFSGGEYRCEYFKARAQDRTTNNKQVALCGIVNAGHTTDIPYVGAPFDLAWSFLKGL